MKKYLLAIVVIFIVLSIGFYVLKMTAPEFQFIALMTGNTLMAILSLSAYLMVKRQIGNKPEAFVRGVYGASFLKLMVCMVAILVYVLLNRTHLHKPTVFILFGIYAIYSAVETILLSKLAREK